MTIEVVLSPGVIISSFSELKNPWYGNVLRSGAKDKEWINQK